jgi:GxxExxY protein
MTDNIIYKDECYAINGAAFSVYKEMGNGFLESVYQECLEYEFADTNIPFVSQPRLDIFFKGRLLKQKFIPDFICYNKIVVELKAVKTITVEHEAQVLNYLQSTGMKLGLIINFGSYPKAVIKRYAL